MSEPEDNTPEPDLTPPLPGRERAPGSYYYDDGTGYEIYTPAEGDDESDDRPPADE